MLIILKVAVFAGIFKNALTRLIDSLEVDTITTFRIVCEASAWLGNATLPQFIGESGSVAYYSAIAVTHSTKL